MPSLPSKIKEYDAVYAYLTRQCVPTSNDGGHKLSLLERVQFLRTLPLDESLKPSTNPPKESRETIDFFAVGKLGTSTAPSVATPEFTLTNDQQVAWNKLCKFLESKNKYFILRGYAGSGKCRAGDAVLSTQKGVQTFREIFRDQGLRSSAVPQEAPVSSMCVATPTGLKQVSGIYTKTVDIVTRVSSYAAARIVGTPNHPVRVLTREGLVWKPISTLLPGDTLVGRAGFDWSGRGDALLSSAEEVKLQLLREKYKVDAAEYRTPTRLIPELARLLGYMVADGCVRAGGFSISSASPLILEDVFHCLRKCFPDFTPVLVSSRGRVPAIHVRSKYLRRWLHVCCGFSRKLLCRARHKQVPEVIRLSSKLLLFEFLSAYLSCDSEFTKYGLNLCSASEELIRQLITIFVILGVAPGKVSRHMSCALNGSGTRRPYYSVTYPALSVKDLVSSLTLRKDVCLPWRCVQDQRRLPQICLDAWSDIVSAFITTNNNCTTLQLADGSVRPCKRDTLKAGIIGDQSRSIDKQHLTRRALERVNWKLASQINPKASALLQFALRPDVWLSEVIEVETLEKTTPVYDVCVPDGHQFLADGLINHNTFLLQRLKELDHHFIYTAPTNKAAKVMSDMLATKAGTIFSFLGIRMESDGEELALVYPKVLPRGYEGSVLVIDESSMLGKKILDFILTAAESMGIKVIFVGDPAQLRPIGEDKSFVWSVTKDPECRALLKEVKRYDNSILTLATALRQCVRTKTYDLDLRSYTDDQYVFKYTQRKFEDKIREYGKDARVLAWRNKTVDDYNKLIRHHLGFTAKFCVGDELLLAAPMQGDPSRGETGIIANTDEELTVLKVEVTTQAVLDVNQNRIDIPVHRLTCDFTDRTLDLNILTSEGSRLLTPILTSIASKAKKEQNRFNAKILWTSYWEIRAKFQRVRYGFAITTHRAQGSTYKAVFVDQRDVLANRDSHEAYQCLYVDATRPTDTLIFN